MRRLSHYPDGLQAVLDESGNIVWEEPEMQGHDGKPTREECARYVEDAVMAAKLEGHAGALEGGEWGQIMRQAAAYLRADADLEKRLAELRRVVRGLARGFNELEVLAGYSRVSLQDRLERIADDACIPREWLEEKQEAE